MDLHYLDEIGGGDAVELAATLPWVTEGTETHFGNQAGAFGCGLSKELCQDSLRQVICLDVAVVSHA
jgi:hypothetical protein